MPEETTVTTHLGYTRCLASGLSLTSQNKIEGLFLGQSQWMLLLLLSFPTPFSQPTLYTTLYLRFEFSTMKLLSADPAWWPSQVCGLVKAWLFALANCYSWNYLVVLNLEVMPICYTSVLSDNHALPYEISIACPLTLIVQVEWLWHKKYSFSFLCYIFAVLASIMCWSKPCFFGA